MHNQLVNNHLYNNHFVQNVHQQIVTNKQIQSTIGLSIPNQSHAGVSQMVQPIVPNTGEMISEKSPVKQLATTIL